MLLDEENPGACADAAAIAREAGGSPFFVIELVRHVQIGDEPANSSTLGEDVTLDRVLMARISRLPDEARRLLEVIAVSGARSARWMRARPLVWKQTIVMPWQSSDRAG